MRIRPGTPSDVPTILEFIRELAAFERAADQVRVTVADLLRDGWALDGNGVPLPDAPPPRFRVLMAEIEDETAGFALYFSSYSTWLGHHGLRLEDLYVTPRRRGQGLGRALLQALAAQAVAEGCGRLEWDVLNWNEPAIGVYRRLGAVTLEEWRIMRLSGDALQRLASSRADDPATTTTSLS